MKTGDYLHFPKVSKLMRTVQVLFSVWVEACTHLGGLLNVISAELSYCCCKTCLWQVWTAWSKKLNVMWQDLVQQILTTFQAKSYHQLSSC